MASSVEDIEQALEITAAHGCHPLSGFATYQDVYKLTYVRGPSGIIVMLAEWNPSSSSARWSRRRTLGCALTLPGGRLGVQTVARSTA